MTLRPNLVQTVGVGRHRLALRHNQLGLRGPDVRSDDPELRVVLIGDSYTYGWGTSNPGTIARQLEALLRKAGRDAEVLNLGEQRRPGGPRSLERRWNRGLSASPAAARYLARTRH